MYHTFNVYANGKKINTVFDNETDPDRVKRSLINHDGYDPGIAVRRVWRSLYVIQGNYGTGWEDESEYDRADRAQAIADFREYRIAAPEYGHRIVRRKVQA